MYSAIQSLFIIFPFLSGKEIILSGESYAGHYIPAMTDFFIAHNNDNSYTGNDKKIKVVSVAIGNGWSIPKIQYNFGSYANNIGILSSPDSRKLESQYHLCVKQVDQGNYASVGACNIIGQVLAASGACPIALEDADSSHHGTGIGRHRHKLSTNTSCFGPLLNYYDTRSYYVDILSSWPSNAEITGDYLNSSVVMKAINVKHMSHGYTECSDAGKYLMVLYGLGVQPQIISILEAGVRVTFYSGQYDFVCNHIGTERMLDQLPWSGKADFASAPGYVWILNQTKRIGEVVSVEKYPAGYGRSTSDGNLTFLVVIGGSHMVPMNVPVAALDLIRRVVSKLSFADFPQEVKVTPTEDAILFPTSEAISAKSFPSPRWLLAVFGFFLAVIGTMRLRSSLSTEQYRYSSISDAP